MNKLPLFTAVNGSELAVKGLELTVKGLETAVDAAHSTVHRAAMAIVEVQTAVNGHSLSHDGRKEPIVPPIRPYMLLRLLETAQ